MGELAAAIPVPVCRRACSRCRAPAVASARRCAPYRRARTASVGAGLCAPPGSRSARGLAYDGIAFPCADAFATFLPKHIALLYAARESVDMACRSDGETVARGRAAAAGWPAATDALVTGGCRADDGSSPSSLYGAPPILRQPCSIAAHRSGRIRSCACSLPTLHTVPVRRSRLILFDIALVALKLSPDRGRRAPQPPADLAR